jgi:hypothetical protein
MKPGKNNRIIKITWFGFKLARYHQDKNKKMVSPGAIDTRECISCYLDKTLLPK